jgi:hypothetical protein
MAKPKRDSMPLTTAFIDQMREAFGEEDINTAMLAGRQGQATFYLLDKATGKEIGARLPGTAVEVTAPQIPFEQLKAKQKAGR